MTGNVENVALRALSTISQRMVINNHLIADSKLISVHERCHLVESPHRKALMVRDQLAACHVGRVLLQILLSSAGGH